MVRGGPGCGPGETADKWLELHKWSWWSGVFQKSSLDCANLHVHTLESADTRARVYVLFSKTPDHPDHPKQHLVKTGDLIRPWVDQGWTKGGPNRPTSRFYWRKGWTA